MKSVSCSQPPLWNDRLLFLRFNPSSFVSIFFFPRTVFLSTAMQQCGVLLGLFFSGKIWTMQFYWKLDACSYSAPVQPSLTQNIHVTALTLLGYSMFNIRNALKTPHGAASPASSGKQEQNCKKWPGLHKIWLPGWGNEGCFISSQEKLW